MSIATFQNHQLAPQGAPLEEQYIQIKIVRWLDHREEFRPTQLMICARVLAEEALRRLQRHAVTVADAKVCESKRMCTMQQHAQKSDGWLLLKSLGEGTAAVSGSTYCTLAALSSGGLITMAAAGTGGALCIAFGGAASYNTYLEATPAKRRRAIQRHADDYQSKTRRVREQIEEALGTLIATNRLQRDLNRVTHERNLANDTISKIDENLNDVMAVATNLRTDLDSANKIAEALSNDIQANEAKALKNEERAFESEATAASYRLVNRVFTNIIRRENEATVINLSQTNAGLREDLNREKTRGRTADMQLDLTRAELRATQNTVQRIEAKFEALIAAMKGNPSERSVPELMQSAASQLHQQEPLQNSEITNVVNPNDLQEEEFIHVFNATNRTPSNGFSSFSNEHHSSSGPGPQDATANYHMVRAEQQITRSSDSF